MARIQYTSPEEMSEENEHLLRTSMDGDDLPEAYRSLYSTDVRNVHRAIGNNVPVLRGFRRVNRTLWEQSGLTSRQRELVVLAVARATNSRYEWHQHVRHALSEGLTPTEIRSIGTGDYSEFTGEETALLRFVTATADGSVESDHYSEVAARFDRETVVGVTMLASSYAGLALALDAMAVETEEEFVGWELENLVEEAD